MLIQRPTVHDWTSLAGLAAGLVLVYLAYLPGLGAGIVLDTPVNLDGLDELDSIDSALSFVFGGVAGPLGRPVALATFLMAPSWWPHDIPALIHTNILIHLINALLLSWAAFLIMREYLGTGPRAVYAAMLAALVWAAAPILVSTTLMPIQRMTSLAALFALAGLVSHLYCRRLILVRSQVGLVLATLGLGFFTLLAALAKENGALLPALLLVLEATLLSTPAGISARRWRLWRLVFLVLPSFAVLAYLAVRSGYSSETIQWRGFSAAERIMTQAVVLWEYLLHTLIPSMRSLGPFTDGYPVYRSLAKPLVLVAVVAWLAVIGSALVLRRRRPLWTFAVGWFLVSHLVESTTIPLELYFEHRNYLPLVGPAIALAAAAVSVVERYRRWLVPGLVGFTSVSLLVTLNTTSLWANRAIAAEVWWEQNPRSARAALYRAEAALAMFDVDKTFEVLKIAAESTDHSLLFDLAAGQLGCRFSRLPPEVGIERMLISAEHARFSHGLPDQLNNMRRWRADFDCDLYDLDDLHTLASRLLDNMAFQSPSAAIGPLERVLGDIRRAQGRAEDALKHYRRSLHAAPVPAVAEQAVLLASPAEAQAILEDFAEHAAAPGLLGRQALEREAARLRAKYLRAASDSE